MWNCLKPDLRKLRKRRFKDKIHQFLLAVLDDESSLIFKITNYCLLNFIFAFLPVLVFPSYYMCVYMCMYNYVYSPCLIFSYLVA